MSNKFFQFKQFTVYQGLCAMKVGTDGVLLGSWCQVSGKQRVLDIGTGTGLIALMIAQRNSEAVIDAIELDQDAFRQAEENFRESPWSHRLTPIFGSFTDYETGGSPKYDLLVSNPPYFENSLKADCAKRSQARHTDTLPFEALLDKASDLLSDGGVLALVYPSDADERICGLAGPRGFTCIRKTFVRGNSGAPVKRVLVEFEYNSRGGAAFLENELIVEVERHRYTNDYIELTKDFYLKM